MFKRAKLVVCHSLWDRNGASLSLGIPVLLSYQRQRKRSASCTSCGRGGGLWFSSRDIPFLAGCWPPLCWSANNWDWAVTTRTWLSAGEGTWGIWSRQSLSLCSVKAVSEGLLVFRLWHSSSRLDYTISASHFLSCFFKEKGIFSNSLTFYSLMWWGASTVWNSVVLV